MNRRLQKISGHLDSSPLTRIGLYAILVIFMAGVLWATLNNSIEDNSENLGEHKENATAHMTLEEKKHISIMDAKIEQNGKDVKTVKEDLKDDIRLLREDMNRGFQDLKAFIKNNNRGG